MRVSWIRWGAIAALLAAAACSGPDAADAYRTAPVDRGEVRRVVSATGALEPVVTVDVGSTVSGPLKTVEVDFNDRVTAGQVIARIDPQSFQARVDQLAAGLAQAQANAAVAQAEWQRYEKLGEAGYASPQLLAQKRAAQDTANAAVRSAAAQLASAKVDLERTVIRAPVDGVVVDRQVDPGQSVAASLQAPTLFLIAQDLAQLQALITIDEADIGEVRVGQPVEFTVDAFPDETFRADVAQVRQQGVANQGVVSYTVVVRAQNPGGRLLPGMTANAEVLVERREEVLRLPNGALRFRPGDPRLQAAAEALGSGGSGRRQGGGALAAAPGPDGPPGGGRGGDRLAQELGLTGAQADAAREAFRAAMESAGPRPGPDAEPAERRAFMRRITEAAMRQIEPTLTPEQKTKLAALRASRGEGGAGGGPSGGGRAATVFVLRKGDRPEPVRVRLGVGDDAFTEILSGDLKEGDLIVTGGGPKAPTAPTAPMGGPPGMRIRGA